MRGRPTLGVRVLAALLLAACQAVPPLPAAEVLVFGEQHDQRDQQRQVAATVRRMAAEGRLAAVVIEMAERGRSTAALDRSATEPDVRAALAWSEPGWPWAAYGPVVMAAVQGGVPVLGADLSRADLRTAMADATLDDRILTDVALRLERAIDEGHCGLLQPAQVPAMRRAQVARDVSIAETVQKAASSGSVVLLTGAQHASRDRGAPWHLVRAGMPRESVQVVMFEGGPGRRGDLEADVWWPYNPTARDADPCDSLRRRAGSVRPR